METYDLDIKNYELEDILSLFHVPHNFTKEDLKKAHKMALQMHPDKSNLDTEYFIFFTEAYKLLARIYYFRTRETAKRPNYDIDMAKSEKLILQNLEKQNKSKEFNKWFNEMFEKVKVKDEDVDTGYGSWFKSNDDVDGGKDENVDGDVVVPVVVFDVIGDDLAADVVDNDVVVDVVVHNDVVVGDDVGDDVVLDGGEGVPSSSLINFVILNGYCILPFIFKTAKSDNGSVPIIFASNTLLSYKITLISSAFSTT